MSRTDHHVPARLRDDLPPLLALLPHWRGKGTNTLGAYVNQLERRVRAELHTFVVLTRQIHRAGGDVEQVAEPEARGRHSACRDFW